LVIFADFDSMFLFMKRYKHDAIITSPNNILNMDGVASEDMNAPKIVPGIDINPSLRPSLYSILFCLAYDTEDAIELLNAAKRLLLAAIVCENPRIVNTGTTIIPPPRPIIEPTIPATKPSGISHRFSNIFAVTLDLLLNLALCSGV
jgi:hypothetical protein